MTFLTTTTPADNLADMAQDNADAGACVSGLVQQAKVAYGAFADISFGSAGKRCDFCRLLSAASGLPHALGSCLCGRGTRIPYVLKHSCHRVNGCSDSAGALHCLASHFVLA